MLPKNRAPQDLLKGLYIPEFIPQDVDLNNFIKEAYLPAKEEEVQAKVINIVNQQRVDQVPVPLTEQEAMEADRQLNLAGQRISAMRTKLELVRSKLDESITVAQNGKELGFKLDLSNKPRLERAARKVFGFKVEEITHSMYKELLRARTQLEQREIDDYADGRIKD